MYQVYNTITGLTPDPQILADIPYVLSGEYAVRKEKQKEDEQGNLLYLHPEDGEEYAWATEVQTVYEDGTEIYLTLAPVMIDDGPLWDWQEIIPTPAEVAAQIQNKFTSAVQAHLDATARLKGYDSILSASSYAALPVGEPFQDEGKKYALWRSAVWLSCYSIMAEVQAGTREIPTVEELLSELPVLSL